MPFVLANFEQALRQDNTHYERFKRSSLHNLVEALRGGFPQPAPHNLAVMIQAIPQIKWRKYGNVKRYLLEQIPAIAPIVRNHLGTVASFHNVSMLPGSNGRIVHTVGWNSSTGNLQDLGHVDTRERVAWGNAPPLTQKFLIPEYRNANHHNGLGTTFASKGRNEDNHDPVGPFEQPGSISYKGPAIHIFQMDQTYEYSDDGGANWHTIPNSGYTITRQMSAVSGHPFFTITKTSVVNPGVTFTNTLRL